MSFETALTGLNAAAADLNVTGNNIANSQTTGFKMSRAEFADIFAASSSGVARNAIGQGVRLASVAQQFTQGQFAFTGNNLDLAINGTGFFRLNDGGQVVYSRAGSFQLDRDGFVVDNSGRRLTGYGTDTVGNISGAIGDLRINTGDVSPQATSGLAITANLHAGSAPPVIVPAQVAMAGGLDPSQSTQTFTTTVADAKGVRKELEYTLTETAPDTWEVTATLDGVPANTTQTLAFDAAGNLVAPIPAQAFQFGSSSGSDIVADFSGLRLDAAAGPAGMTQAMAFDPAAANPDPDTYSFSTSTTVYDSLGRSHLATIYFVKEIDPLDPPGDSAWTIYTRVDGQAPSDNSGQRVTFNSAGELTSGPPANLEFAAAGLLAGAEPLSIAPDLTNLSQYGTPFSVTQLSQDGFPAGQFAGLSIEPNGMVFARYSNGQAETLGQIVLAQFPSPQNLQQIGNTSWVETYASGAAVTDAPGNSSLGQLQAGSLEQSNVNVSEQLVKMITAQRAYQANAKMISTQDQITQEILNIR